MLQFAALPDGVYEPDTIACYLEPDRYVQVPESDDDEENGEAEIPDPDPSMDIENLSGFAVFSAESTLAAPATLQLDAIIERLGELGWLTAREDEGFSIHAFTRQILQEALPLSTAYHPELVRSLEYGFFASISNAFSDVHRYEMHLWQFLAFFPERPEASYLNLLWKRCQFYQSTVRYTDELTARKRHLRLAQQVFKADGQDMVEIYLELQDNLIRRGKYHEAKDYGEKALAIAEKCYWPKHPLVGQCQSNLGEVYRKLGEYDRARELLETALQNTFEIFGENTPSWHRHTTTWHG